LTIRQQQSPCLTKNEHSSVAGTEAAGTAVSKRMRRRKSRKSKEL